MAEIEKASAAANGSGLREEDDRLGEQIERSTTTALTIAQDHQPRGCDSPTVFWSAQIATRWRRAVEHAVGAFLAIGNLLICAKAALPHGEFQRMVEDELPFRPRAARMFMAIARDPRISKR